jgi:ribosomal protein S18 acetylase RimI-like enzyme
VPGISLRAETDTDDAFLRVLYASIRAEEMAQLQHWSDNQKNEFLAMQFDAQHSHYQKHYPDARFDIIEQAGQPIGRLYLADVERELRLMDIALLPERRNQGIGTDLTRAVLDFAGRAGLQVTLHVEEENPAKRMYDRLGFVVVGEQSFYKKMAWQP